ncbi:MAG: sugar phosphate isomerase/epimerase [Nitrospiraceae bacterium]|nr:sugar phosphate isomerase/epimerase [Nitrospiraceae bacterium]
MALPHAHVPFNRIAEYKDLIRKERLNLEIYFGSAVLDDISPADIEGLAALLDYRPSLSIHAPFMDLSPGAVDSKVRQATTERFFHVLDIAEVLRPKVIVFHSGYEKWKYALNIDLWLEKSLQTWRPVSARASDIGVKIAIENIFEDEPSNLKLLMKEMDSDDFGVCFDTGHCHLFSRAGLGEWMRDLNPHILELHLHDNDRTSDQHLPMGDGTFDFDTFFRLLDRKDCVYTLEAHSPQHFRKSMAYLKTKGIVPGS